MNNYYIIGLIILIIIIIIAIYQGKKNSGKDKDFYNLNNDKKYRNGIYRQISLDFKPYIVTIFNNIDDLNDKVLKTTSEITQAQYDAMLDIFRSADKINRIINDYWNSTRFNKDFSYYISLHYASHMLANSLKSEQQNVKEAFLECKKRQDSIGRKIEHKKVQQKNTRGKQQSHITKEIGELCNYHKSISIWKSHMGKLNSKYNQRVTDQNIITGKYRDYIADNFGKRGRNWRDRCRRRALLRK